MQNTRPLKLECAMAEALLGKLEDAITSVQLKYGGHAGLAIEDDYCVANLCRCLENVFLDHAKIRKSSPLQKV